ncbi:unnamed protein product, partial [Tetraodon nigroviridis]
ERRFQNLTLEQVQALDRVLTEVIPIHGRGNFPTLQVRAKDIIRVVKDRLVERRIRVKDVRLNGATASHVLLRDNGLGHRDLDIIFGVELPRQEDLQVIKEVVLGSLRDLLPCGVNRRKITCLTMKEAYVQKMVKVFNENDRWSLISLSNDRAKTVGLRFVSSLRRQFEFSVDSFQIILDRMLESYWEAERRQGQGAPDAVGSTKTQFEDERKEREDSHFEFSFPPPAKKTCSTSQDIVPEYCPSPKLQRKMSRKLIVQPEKWSLLTDLSDGTAQMFPPREVPKPDRANCPSGDSAQGPGADVEKTEASGVPAGAPCGPALLPATDPAEQSVKPKHSKKPPESAGQSGPDVAPPPRTSCQTPGPEDGVPPSTMEPAIVVEAECMYGDFQQAMEHLHHRLIATHNPEEIRGGGLLKYSDLLVRSFRPASQTEIKSLERYMCSRFFIDFPDVSEQQRKIEAYLQCHFVGNEEASKYDYLMTLRRVIDESTVCLMGHERRQTLNMITVLALRVLGEQNAIPNTANVTCFYQPAPYVSEPLYSSYFITQAQPPLVYHPYPLHLHMQSGLV